MKKLIVFSFLFLFAAGFSYAWDLPLWGIGKKLDGPITILQNSDTLTISGDGSDWLGIPSEGRMAFRSTYTAAGTLELALLAETYVQPTGNVTDPSTYAASSSKFYWDTNYNLSGAGSHTVGHLNSCENTGTGTLIKAIGNESKVLASNAAGTVTSAIGYWIYVPPSHTGTIGTYYGLYYETDPVGTITTEYCLYNAEAEASINTLGNVGIGSVTQPTYDLEISKINTAGTDRPQMQFKLNDTNVTTDQVIGDIYWHNIDTGQDQPTNVARISAHSFNEFGWGSYLAFYTHDGTEGGEGSEPVERLRIGPTGVVSSQAEIIRKYTVTTNDADSAQTYTAAQMLGGLIRRGTGNQITAARTDVTATAAALVAAISGCIVGSGFEFSISNEDDTHTVALDGGVGVTISPNDPSNAIAVNSVGKFLVVVTNATLTTEAVTVYSLGNAAF